MLSDTPILREICGDQKSRASGNTLRSKDFPGGNIFLGSANVASDLASDPMRDVLIDELDRCDKACGTEGDIVTLAEARQESFGEDAFSLFTSTPSGKKPRPMGDQPLGVSKILMLFNESDQRHWFCPCQKCGTMQTLKWAQVVWEKDRPETARYICESEACKHPHNDAERIAMIEAGEWRATAPFAGRRGYFLNGIASLSKPQRGCQGKLHQMARDFLRAKRRGVEALRAWVNTFLCECFDDESAESIDPGPLFKRRVSFGKMLPQKVCYITAGVDIHPDRIEAQVIGWGDGEESWPINYHILLGDVKKPEVWKELDTVLLQRYDHPLGVTLGIERACVDTGNSTDETYEFCRPRQMRGVHAVKGIKGFGLPVMNLPKKSGVKRVRLWMVAKNTALRTIAARLKMEVEGPGYVHFRNDAEPLFGEDYFAQLAANSVTTIKRAGIEWQDFDPGGRRDEAMDTFVYALAAVRRSEVNFQKIMERLIVDAKANKEGIPEPKPKRVMAGSGWSL